MTQIQTVIEETIFRNDENGYSVVAVRAGKANVTVVGILPRLSPGEQVVFDGEYSLHPHYGKQFKAEKCDIKKPSTLLGVERFLGSGLIKGVGPATARQIVEKFGMKTLDVLNDSPMRLCEISGIGRKRALQIAAGFADTIGSRQTMIFLQSYGVTSKLSVKISKYYGEQAQELLQQNPYRLVDDIEGVGFQTADRIAVSMGIPPDSEFRLQSGLKFVLSEAGLSAGHTYLPYDMLLNEAVGLLKCDRELVENQLKKLLLERELIVSDMNGTKGVFLKNMYYAETEVAVRLLTLAKTVQTTIDHAVSLKLSEFERLQHVTLGADQRKAVSTAIQTGVMVITGGPGTGKTTIINCILSLLNTKGTELAAPTGRAAKRMSEATGHEAKTIHRLLEYSGEKGGFTRNQENPLDCTCLIVDEMSMVDLFLMRSLLRALKNGTKLILVGDADQLPSVGAGNVLRDILCSEALPCVRLTEIYRQDMDSLIVVNAHRINHGEMPFLNRKNSDFFFDRRLNAEEAAQTIVSLCTSRLPAYLNVQNGVKSIQVLAPAKKGVCGVSELNKCLQAALNPPMRRKSQLQYGDTIFRHGDKVMHIKNNYALEWTTPSGEEGAGVFNGDMGFITEIDAENRKLTVTFDDNRMAEYDNDAMEELDLAYCLSVHKSQGSEFPAVVMPVVGGPKMLLNRNLFYTALTRARKLVVLVGNEGCIAEMVENNHIMARYTALEKRIREMMQPLPPQSI